MDNESHIKLLTECEQETLQLYCDGYDRAEIARIRDVKPNTVDNQRESLLKKMKCGSIARATPLGVHFEWIELRFIGE